MLIVIGAAGLVFASGACTKTETPNTGAATTTSAPSMSAPSTTAPGASLGAVSAAKTAYLAEVNELCKTMNDSVAALAPVPASADRATAAAGIVQVYKLVSETIEAGRKVAPPPGDEAAVAEVWRTADALLDAANSMAAALASGDVARASSLAAEADTLRSEANAVANAYGLSECGKGS